MDAISDPGVEQVTVMKSARVGYTKILDATVGYYMHMDPCPIMVVQPTVEDAEGYSKEELAPMLRDCRALAELMPDPSSRDSNNTILHKIFPGGSLSVVGANSGRGFRRVSRKVVLFDEVDGYPPSAGTEGDQIKLGHPAHRILLGPEDNLREHAAGGRQQPHHGDVRVGRSAALLRPVPAVRPHGLPHVP